MQYVVQKCGLLFIKGMDQFPRWLISLFIFLNKFQGSQGKG